MTQTYRPKNFVLAPHDLPRLEHCPASRVYWMKHEKPSSGQWYGIAIHRFLEYAKSRSRGAALAYIQKKFPRQLHVCELINTDEIPDGETEPSLVIDVHAMTCTSGHYLDCEPDRHFFAKGDLVFYDKCWTIWDFKTGSGPKPEESEQLRTLCTGVWLREGATEERVDGAITIVTSNGGVVPRLHTFYAEELEKHAKRIRRLVMVTEETRLELREEGAQPEFVPGPWCLRCDIQTACHPGIEWMST